MNGLKMVWLGLVSVACSMGLAGCAVGAPEATGVVRSELLVDLSGGSHAVEWARLADGSFAATLDDGSAYRLGFEGQWWTIRDASSTATVGVLAGAGVVVRILGRDGEWSEIVGPAVLDDGVERSAQSSQDAVRALTPSGLAPAVTERAVEIALLARAMEFGQASTTTVEQGSQIGAARASVFGLLVGEILGIIADAVVTRALTPNCTTDGTAEGNLRCMDCCDAHWMGHYESLKACYINCGFGYGSGI